MRGQYKRRQLPENRTELLVNTCRTLREKRIIWTLLDTGIRVSELAALSRPQIDFVTHSLNLGEPLSVGGEDQRRVVPLTPRIAPLLESWFGKHEGLGLCSRSIQRVIQDVAARAGLDGRVSARALRDTFAVAAVMKGASPLELQLLFGHKHLATTAIYFCLARETMTSPPPRQSGARIGERRVSIAMAARLDGCRCRTF